MRFINRTAPVWRILGGLLALTLAFTNLDSARAGGGGNEPPAEATATAVVPANYQNHPVGIINASFGLENACLLDGWQTQGSARVANNGAGLCKAVLKADRSNPSLAPGVTTATLNQTFVVNTDTPNFAIITNRTTDNPNQLFAAQTVTIYGSAGNVIAYSSFNSNTETSVLSFDLAAYAGQSVRLQFAARVDTRLAESPRNVTLEVDFGLKVGRPDPETLPGGG